MIICRKIAHPLRISMNKNRSRGPLSKKAARAVTVLHFDFLLHNQAFCRRFDEFHVQNRLRGVGYVRRRIREKGFEIHRFARRVIRFVETQIHFIFVDTDHFTDGIVSSLGIANRCAANKKESKQVKAFHVF